MWIHFYLFHQQLRQHSHNSHRWEKMMILERGWAGSQLLMGSWFFSFASYICQRLNRNQQSIIKIPSQKDVAQVWKCRATGVGLPNRNRGNLIGVKFLKPNLSKPLSLSVRKRLTQLLFDGKVPLSHVNRTPDVETFILWANKSKTFYETATAKKRFEKLKVHKSELWSTRKHN